MNWHREETTLWPAAVEAAASAATEAVATLEIAATVTSAIATRDPAAVAAVVPPERAIGFVRAVRTITSPGEIRVTDARKRSRPMRAVIRPEKAAAAACLTKDAADRTRAATEVRTAVRETIEMAISQAASIEAVAVISAAAAAETETVRSVVR